MSKFTQHWIGDSPYGTPIDGVCFLQEVVSWAVSSPNARYYHGAIAEAKQRGWISTRQHHYPDERWAPDTFYCLTEKGFEQLKEWNFKSYEIAKKLHAWYEDWPSRNTVALNQESV